MNTLKNSLIAAVGVLIFVGVLVLSGTPFQEAKGKDISPVILEAREVIVGPAGTLRLGDAIADFAAGDCRNAFGDGARWATTRDLRDLSWELTASAAPGWVNFHPISFDPSTGTYVDISGWTGTIASLVCGVTTGSPPSNHPWITISGGRGLFATRDKAQPTTIACSIGELPALCVALPAP